MLVVGTPPLKGDMRFSIKIGGWKKGEMHTFLYSLECKADIDIL